MSLQVHEGLDAPLITDMYHKALSNNELAQNNNMTYELKAPQENDRLQVGIDHVTKKAKLVIEIGHTLLANPGTECPAIRLTQQSLTGEQQPLLVDINGSPTFSRGIGRLILAHHAHDKPALWGVYIDSMDASADSPTSSYWHDKNPIKNLANFREFLFVITHYSKRKFDDSPISEFPSTLPSGRELLTAPITSITSNE